MKFVQVVSAATQLLVIIRTNVWIAPKESFKTFISTLRKHAKNALPAGIRRIVDGLLVPNVQMRKQASRALNLILNAYGSRALKNVNQLNNLVREVNT